LPPLSGSSLPNSLFNRTYSCNVTSCGITQLYCHFYPVPATPAITSAASVFVSTPATSYQWYFNGTPINGQTYTPLQTAPTVEISDQWLLPYRFRLFNRLEFLNFQEMKLSFHQIL
jgi:hypothetical protein